jgi:hypothetical protein
MLSQPNHWTREEVALLAQGITPVGRSHGAARQTIKHIRRHFDRDFRRTKKGEVAPLWTAAEIEQLLRNEVPATRTPRAFRSKRLKCGLAPGVLWAPWSPTELELARQLILPAGRTREAMLTARRKFGLIIPRPALIFRADPADQLAALNRLSPAGLPRHARDELVGIATLLLLEGQASSPETAMLAAKREFYRQHPLLGAPVSLDAPLFGDGSSTLADRLDSSTELWSFR